LLMDLPFYHQLLGHLIVNKITLRQLQSLCGSLAFCAKALPAGRAFSRRLCLACER
jgi:hypothetical protein